MQCPTWWVCSKIRKFFLCYLTSVAACNHMQQCEAELKAAEPPSMCLGATLIELDWYHLPTSCGFLSWTWCSVFVQNLMKHSLFLNFVSVWGPITAEDPSETLAPVLGVWGEQWLWGRNDNCCSKSLVLTVRKYSAELLTVEFLSLVRPRSLRFGWE